MNKAVFRKDKIPFSMIPNELIQDSELSAMAKSVYCYLASRPDGWVFYNVEIINNFKEGRTAVLRGIKELENIGWLSSKQLKENGRFTNKEYTLHYEKPITENPSSVKMKSENPTSEMRNHNNNDYNNNDLNKKENNKKEKINNNINNKIFESYLKGISIATQKDFNKNFKYEEYKQCADKLIDIIRNKKIENYSEEEYAFISGQLLVHYYVDFNKKIGVENIGRIKNHHKLISNILNHYKTLGIGNIEIISLKDL